MIITEEKKQEFAILFQEFLNSYPSTPDGLRHLSAYNEQRKQGKRNFETVINAYEKGEDITDLVLLKLLPYTDTENNKKRGVWVHIAPALATDVRIKFEAANWTKNEDWPLISKAIFNFINNCYQNFDKLEESCLNFLDLPYTKGFQTGMLSPILNALNPEQFLLVNNKSRNTINYLTENNYTQKLADYPIINQIGFQLIQNLKSILEKANLPALKIEDIFDMFCHWLVAIKKFQFRNINYWKISPGENAWQWEECKNNNFIAIGWEQLGDISQLNKIEFNQLRDQIIENYSEFNWNKAGINQVWTFAHNIKEGDIIIANRGTTDILGIGKVTGNYYFIPNIKHGHRLPIQWYDTTIRKINESGWRRTLININQDKFEEIMNNSLATNQELAEPFLRIFKDRKEAEFAFNFIAKTVSLLGIESLDDQRFSLTITNRGLNLNFCNWRILGFDKNSYFELTLMDDSKYLKANWSKRGEDFSTKEEEPNFGIYIIPLVDVKNLENDQDFKNIYEQSLLSIRNRFQNWTKSIYTKYHISEVMEALFNLDQRNIILTEGIKIDDSLTGEYYFTDQTFQLLEKLHNNPTKEFYNQYQDYFKLYVENPFKNLFNYIASQLPLEITNLMETEKRLFSRILKNDYGKGQTWDFIWGAFYPKDGKRTEDPQLFLFLNYETLECGFYIGKDGNDKRTKFINFCQNNQQYMLNLIEQIYNFSNNVYLGSRDNYEINEAQEIIIKNKITPENWLKNIDKEDLHLAIIIPRQQVLEYSQTELTNNIINFYQNLFPLVLIPIYDDPIPKIDQYLEHLTDPENSESNENFTMIDYNNFWWVNQGTTYELNKEFQFLWSPKEAKDGRKFAFWDNMTIIKIDNIIFHYSKGQIIGISKVIHPIIMAKRPQTYSGNLEDEGYLLPIKYFEVNPKILLNEIPIELRTQELKGSPFNKNGEINQGYLYPISNNLGNYLLENFADKIPDFFQFKKEIETIETEQLKTINPEYTLENLYQDTYLKQDKINPILKAIERKKQIILQGSPGTGKTFLAQHLAEYLISNCDGFCELVQFHPSYSYEDFIQGIRPISNNGNLEYKMIKGRFLEFCEKAKQSKGKCVLIIDEINRGNLASIFGELMYLLEYRDHNIKLAGSNENFSIPKNVIIIGTMNTADRSIALVDHALRRRFSFITINPNYDILKTYHQQQTKLKIDDLIKVLKELNKTINDPHYQLGISFFLTKELKENIEDIWMMEIEPYLEEYFFDNLDKVKDFSWQNIKDRIKF